MICAPNAVMPRPERTSLAKPSQMVGNSSIAAAAIGSLASGIGPPCTNVVERGQILVVEREVRGSDVLLEVGQRRGARDEQDALVEVQQPGQRDLRGRGAVPGGD